MMPRQQSLDANSSNNNNNMNVNPHGNMNYSARSGGGNNPNSGKPSAPGMSASDHVRRYSHHSQGSGGGDSAPGGSSAASGATGGQGAVMGDFGGLPNQFPLPHTARAGLAAFNPGAAGGMNAAMNPSFYMQPVAAMGEHLDFRGGGNNGATTNASPAVQAEREEELLLNLLIARRQRQAMRGPEHPMGAAGSGETSWADDWMRLRQQQEQLQGATGGAEHNPFDGMATALQGGGDGSRRGSASARMSLGTPGMGQLNMNNINMPGASAAQNQFLSDSSSRLQSQRGSGMGLQMGSPQGAWGGNTAMAGGGAMHSHPNTPRNDNAYAHQRNTADMNMNTQLELDVLQRADPMMRPNMMYDARMAEQGGMGQNPYHQFQMGRPHGQSHLHDRALGYGKRHLEGPPGIKGGEKAGNPQHQMQQFFNSPQKPSPPEDVQPVKKRRLHKKKPADMPRRPLSAYNLFFSEERERILKEIEGKSGDDTSDKKDDGDKKEGDEAKPKALLRPLLPSEKKRRPHRKTHGKISFQELATKVGQRWKALPDDRRKYYQDLAQEDMKRQKKAMEEYYQRRSALTANEASKGVEG